MSEAVPLAPAPSKAGALVKYMQAKQGAFAAVASKHLTAERMVRIVGALLSRQPALAECTPISVLTSVMAATQLGLDPTGIGGQGYLVPFKRSEKRGRDANGKDLWVKIPEAQFIPGYRGLMEIAYRTGEVEVIQPFAVHKGDHYKVHLGSNPRIEHEPTALIRSIDTLTDVYCVVTFKTGRTTFRYLPRVELDAIKEQAIAKTPEWNRAKSAWNTHPVQMMLKSVVRRMCNWLKQTPELSLGMALSDADETGEGIDTAMVAAQLGADLDQLGGKQALEEGAVVSTDGEQRPESDGQTDEPAPKSRTESVVKRVRQNKAEREVVATQDAPQVEVPDEPPTTQAERPAAKATGGAAAKLMAAKTMVERSKALVAHFLERGSFESEDKAMDAMYDFCGDRTMEVRDLKDDAKWSKIVVEVAAADWRPRA